MIIDLFEDVYLEPPKDHNLKVIWEKIMEDEISTRILKTNKKLLSSEIKRNGLLKVIQLHI